MSTWRVRLSLAIYLCLATTVAALACWERRDDDRASPAVLRHDDIPYLVSGHDFPLADE